MRVRDMMKRRMKRDLLRLLPEALRMSANSWRYLWRRRITRAKESDY